MYFIRGKLIILNLTYIRIDNEVNIWFRPLKNEWESSSIAYDYVLVYGKYVLTNAWKST